MDDNLFIGKEDEQEIVSSAWEPDLATKLEEASVKSINDAKSPLLGFSSPVWPPRSDDGAN